MTRAPNTEMEHARRRGIANTVIAASGTQADFAKALGLSPPAAFKWLRDHAPDLHRKLKGDRIKTLDRHTVLVRLLLLKSVEGIRGAQGRLGHALGLSHAGISTFKQLWAPDGLDAAIADLMPEDRARG